MKITSSWLKDHLATEKSVDELAAKLNAIGLEVESIEDPGKRSAPSLSPRSSKSQKHPNADKLQVVQVRDKIARRRSADGGRLRRAERSRRHGRGVRGPRHLHSRLEDHAGEEAGARRRLQRHDVLGR